MKCVFYGLGRRLEVDGFGSRFEVKGGRGGRRVGGT